MAKTEAPPAEKPVKVAAPERVAAFRTGLSAEAIEREYDEAEVAFREVMRAKFENTKAEGKRLYIPFEETPPARFGARFLEYAETHPDDPSAFEALRHAERVLVEQDKPGHEFFVIIEGTAAVKRSNRKIATLGAGVPDFEDG